VEPGGLWDRAPIPSEWAAPAGQSDTTPLSRWSLFIDQADKRLESTQNQGMTECTWCPYTRDSQTSHTA
jgi:hypothetical protein